MRFFPTVPVGIGDQKLLKFLTDVIKSLSGVLDLNTYTLEIVWNPPFSLQVPTFGNMPRKTSPDIVRVARAVATDSTLTPVHFGATSWVWQGSGQVQILDVDGLVAGAKYSLTFEVVG